MTYSENNQERHSWLGPMALTTGLTLLITVLDQITKIWAYRTLGPDTDRNPIVLLPGILQFRYVQNTGAAFGIFRDSSLLLGFVSIGVVIFLAVMFRKHIATSWLLGIAFGLQFGGAIGNIIDRFRLGFVIDFVDFPQFPTFNVADMGITVGVTLLGWYLLFLAPVDEHESEPVGFSENSSQGHSGQNEFETSQVRRNERNSRMKND